MKYLLENEETERLLFRAVDSRDFDAWLKFFEDPRSFLHWNMEWRSAEVLCREWYERQARRYENDEGGMNAIIEKSSGELIGHSGLLIQQVDGMMELEIAYSLLAKHWHKGYATEAAIKCKVHAFKNNLATSLISIISLSNAPSANVALRIGMSIDKQTWYQDNQVNIFRIGQKTGIKTVDRL